MIDFGKENFLLYAGDRSADVINLGSLFVPSSLQKNDHIIVIII